MSNFPYEVFLTSHKKKSVQCSRLPGSNQRFWSVAFQRAAHFNKLVKRIETLQRKSKEDTSKFTELSRFYHSHVTPSAMQLTNLKMQLCEMLDLKRTRVKLSRSANYHRDNNIRLFLDEVVREIEPDDETKKLYQKYFDEFPEEAEQQLEEMANDMFASMFENQFVFKIDPSHLKGGPILLRSRNR